MNSVPAGFVVPDAVLSGLSLQRSSLAFSAASLSLRAAERWWMRHLKALSFVMRLFCVSFPPVRGGEIFRSSFSRLSSWPLCSVVTVVSWCLKLALSSCNGGLT